uniref:Uncharacterized protein n=1 Tax=Rhizophora mucronata TaxID=61149 RepID=A0A2P2QU91_RHIMU
MPAVDNNISHEMIDNGPMQSPSPKTIKVNLELSEQRASSETNV